MAALSSIQDQFAMPILFRVGSGVAAGSSRAGIWTIEMIHTLE
jgi:hypothetical protein